jgi:hypothetical protein
MDLKNMNHANSRLKNVVSILICLRVPIAKLKKQKNRVNGFGAIIGLQKK